MTEEQLYQRVAQILDEARGQVARTVNTAMVQAYWLIGREIVLVEQGGQERAGYGEQVIDGLARRLTARFGRGLGVATLRRARSFFLAFPVGSAIRSTVLIESDEGDSRIRSTLLIESDEGDSRIRSTLLIESCEDDSRSGTLKASTAGTGAHRFPPRLGWSHYLALLRVKRDDARAFYEIEAAREGWSVRELERQIGSLLFERLGKHRSPDEVRALGQAGQEVTTPRDVIKDPFVLEFLDLRERSAANERGLEQAIIDRLEELLLEMGKGFCFVARQKRITLEGDHFYVDLVFYNRLLRCFVLVDLKLGKLSHQDLGQMQMYVNYFDRFQRVEHEAATIGIVLCSEKNDAMVKITLPESCDHIVAARYQTCLPTEEELRAELTREREKAERVLRLAAADPV